MKDRLVPALLTCAFLLLVWGPGEPFPTQDGPAHLYNSSLLLQLSSSAPGSDAPAIARVYELRPGYTSALPGHLLLGICLRIGGVAHAENLLISLYGVCLLWVLARGAHAGSGWRTSAYLALPLTLNLCLDMGFYNFCLALPCLLRVVTWWASESRHASSVLGAAVALLTAVLHPAAGMILVGTIAAAQSAAILLSPTQERRAGLRFLIPLLPAAAFLAWHLAGVGGEAIAWHDPRARIAEVLVPLTLFHGSNLSLFVAVGVGAVLWLQLAVLLRNWRAMERRTARLLAAAGLILFGALVAPDEAASGGYIGLRLNTIFFLLLLCTVGSGRAARRVSLGVAAASLALAVLTVGALLHEMRTQGGRFDALMRLSPEIAAGSTVLGIAAGDWLPADDPPLVPPFARPNVHAAHYLGVGRDVVVLNNYEARHPSFPVRYREGMSPYGSVLRADDDEWRYPEVSPVLARSCASSAIVWEAWTHPATRRAFSEETVDLVSQHYEVVATAGSYTLLRCKDGALNLYNPTGLS